MSPHAEDSDPLLAFTIEPGAAVRTAPPPEPAPQPIAPTEDAPQQPPPPAPLEALIARIDQLERARDDSRSQVSALTSEVATLVRVVSDIRRQVSRPIAPVTPPLPRPTRSRLGAAPAIAGLVIGLGLGVVGWRYLSGDADFTSAAPAALSPQALVAASAPAQVVPVTAEAPPTEAPTLIAPQAPQAPPAPQAPKAPQAPQAPQTPKAPRFVGTLSIDADPGGDVFVNRERAGRTPLRLENLRAGSHLIWIERDGYRRFTRVVHVPSDRVTRLSAELEPIAR